MRFRFRLDTWSLSAVLCVKHFIREKWTSWPGGAATFGSSPMGDRPPDVRRMTELQTFFLLLQIGISAVRSIGRSVASILPRIFNSAQLLLSESSSAVVGAEGPLGSLSRALELCSLLRKISGFHAFVCLAANRGFGQSGGPAAAAVILVDPWERRLAL